MKRGDAYDFQQLPTFLIMTNQILYELSNSRFLLKKNFFDLIDLLLIFDPHNLLYE